MLGGWESESNLNGELKNASHCMRNWNSVNRTGVIVGGEEVRLMEEIEVFFFKYSNYFIICKCFPFLFPCNQPASMPAAIVHRSINTSIVCV